MTVIDLKKINGGTVDARCEMFSSTGFAVFMTAEDFEYAIRDKLGKGVATVVMTPNTARHLAYVLRKEADKCEQLNRGTRLS